jgi:mRNA interferase MazF
MRRGEIWTVSLPSSSDGREQGGRRPGIVVQDEHFGQRSPLVLVVPVTSQLAALRFPGTVQLDPTEENGLSVPSVAMAFQLRALDRKRFVERTGTLATEDLSRVIDEIIRLLGEAGGDSGIPGTGVPEHQIGDSPQPEP